MSVYVELTNYSSYVALTVVRFKVTDGRLIGLTVDVMEFKTNNRAGALRKMTPSLYENFKDLSNHMQVTARLLVKPDTIPLSIRAVVMVACSGESS